MELRWNEPFSYQFLESFCSCISVSSVRLVCVPGAVQQQTTSGIPTPPTERVDGFFRPQDVRRGDEVMGEIRAQADEVVSSYAMQWQLAR